MVNPRAVAARPQVLTAERLLSPLSIQEFVADYWGRRHLVLHREDPRYYGRLFGFGDVDRYLSVAARGTDASVFLGRDGKIHRHLDAREVEAKELYATVHAGGSVVLDAIERFWPPAAELVAEIGHALSVRAKAEVFATPPGGQAAPIHPDVWDGFILQLEGAKRWFVYDARVYEAVETLEQTGHLGYSRPGVTEEPPVLEEVVLEAGDFLYLPRGMVHQAMSPPDRASLHMTVFMTPTYWIDVLKTAAEAVSLDHPELSDPLPPGFEWDPEVRDRLRERFAALLRLVAERSSFDRAADAFAAARKEAHDNPADGHVEQILRLHEIDLDTRLVRRRGRVPRLVSDRETVRLEFGSSHVQASAALAPAFEFVRDRRDFLVRELPGAMSDKSRTVLAQRLVREGLLRADLDRESS